MGIEASADLSELGKALAAAQADIKAAVKDRSNPFFKSSYATLDSIWEACRGPLTRHGLSVVQSATSDGPAVTVTTMLLHSSGQWVRSPLTLQGKDASPQAIGSAITYARRYALGAMVGVTSDEDDDGNGSQPPKGASQRKAAAPPSAETTADASAPPHGAQKITAAQGRNLREAADARAKELKLGANGAAAIFRKAMEALGLTGSSADVHADMAGKLIEAIRGVTLP